MPKKKQQVTIPLTMDASDALYLKLNAIAAMKQVPIQTEICERLMRSLDIYSPPNGELTLIDYISRHLRDRSAFYKKPKKGD